MKRECIICNTEIKGVGFILAADILVDDEPREVCQECSILLDVDLIKYGDEMA